MLTLFEKFLTKRGWRGLAVDVDFVCWALFFSSKAPFSPPARGEVEENIFTLLQTTKYSPKQPKSPPPVRQFAAQLFHFQNPILCWLFKHKKQAHRKTDIRLHVEKTSTDTSKPLYIQAHTDNWSSFPPILRSAPYSIPSSALQWCIPFLQYVHL